MKKVLAIILSSLLVISAVGCSKPSTEKHNSAPNSNETAKKEAPVEIPSKDEINLDKAIELALREIDGTVVSAEYEHGTNSYYEVDIVKDKAKHEIEVEAKTGNILRNEIDNNYTYNIGEIKITLDEAKDIALKNIAGGTIKSLSLEKSGNVDIYNFDILKDKHDYDVEINALDGSVIKSEKDLND
ncbi:hypothetical protein CHL78_007760 [Romboutsia weinsteinii]|uniref:PepSY domain-containing protein n=1 Tax=Romboutsia weinsteinii TaxID=2020949 RepID=A0A371J521_9FIRM|nr:PepSY domain-containing protein [Romboutsia weinsteinii]RDY27890.1 hypothetical protein CHL78_007760 [Romboutsia weinsteinii]